MEFHLFLFLTCLSSIALAQNSEEVGTWAVEEGNTTCILVSLDATLDVAYPALFSEGSTTFTKTEQAVVTLPRNAVVDEPSSSCSTNKQRIVLRWPGPFAHKLSIEFGRDSTMTVVKSVFFEYDLRDSDSFPNATWKNVTTARSSEGKALLKFPAASYWECETGVQMKLESPESFETLLHATNVRLEAFRNSSDKAFNGVPQVCAADPSTTTSTTSTTTTTTTSTTTPSTASTSTSTTPSSTTSTTTPSTVPITTQSPPAAVWSVKNSTNGDYCVLAFFSTRFTIYYNATHAATANSTYVGKTELLELSSSASVVQEQSYCDTGSVTPQQRIVLQWGTYKYNLSLTFTQQSVSGNTILKEAKLQYDVNDEAIFPSHTSIEKSLITAVTTEQVATISSHMYMQCLTGFSTQMMTDGPKDLNATMAWSNVRLEAFRHSNTTTFDDQADVCPGDSRLTTVAPIVTSTAPPTPPLVGAFYNLTYPNGSQCLMIHFDLSITAMYYKKDASIRNGTVASINNGTINHSLSYCNQNRSALIIDGFLPGWRLRLQFDNSSGKAYMSQVQLIFNLSSSWKFPDADDDKRHELNTTSLNRWSATLGHSYKCLTRQDSIKLDTAGQRAVDSMTLMMNQVRLRAFVPFNETIHNGTQSWGQDDECGMDILTNDIVPIAVGCALAALVVIVLIAYVIGRRRNRARGYESM